MAKKTLPIYNIENFRHFSNENDFDDEDELVEEEYV